MYSNDSLGIVMWEHRPAGRFAPHGKICDILRAAIKSQFSANMWSLRMWYSVNIYLTYRLLHTFNFFQMLMQINRSNWGHHQNGALCPMLLYTSHITKLLSSFRQILQFRFRENRQGRIPVKSDQNKAISVHVLWGSFRHRSTPVLWNSHQKINFLHYISVTAVKYAIVPVQSNNI